MKPRTLAIKEHLINRMTYRNRHAIEFDVLDDSILVSFTDYHNPKHHYIDFFLSYERNIIRFISDFRIRSTRDLDKVSIDRLWELFWQGRGKVYCALEYSMIYFPLYYKCIDGKLVAIDQQNIKMEVTESLKSVSDFMEYTYQLYQSISILPQNSSFLPQSSL